MRASSSSDYIIHDNVLNFMKTTIKEIEEALGELKNAMVENIQINTEENDIKIRRNASHYRLLKARETVYSLKFN